MFRTNFSRLEGTGEFKRFKHTNKKKRGARKVFNNSFNPDEQTTVFIAISPRSNEGVADGPCHAAGLEAEYEDFGADLQGFERGTGAGLETEGIYDEGSIRVAGKDVLLEASCAEFETEGVEEVNGVFEGRVVEGTEDEVSISECILGSVRDDKISANSFVSSALCHLHAHCSSPSLSSESLSCVTVVVSLVLSGLWTVWRRDIVHDL